MILWECLSDFSVKFYHLGGEVVMINSMLLKAARKKFQAVLHIDLFEIAFVVR